MPPAPDHCSSLQDCRFLALLQADLGIPGTLDCFLACLVASLWRLGTLFRKVFEYFEPKNGYVVMLVSRLLFLMAFRSESGCLGLENYSKHFGRDVLQKLNFDEVGILIVPVSIFHYFGWSWTNFHVDIRACK